MFLFIFFLFQIQILYQTIKGDIVDVVKSSGPYMLEYVLEIENEKLKVINENKTFEIDSVYDVIGSALNGDILYIVYSKIIEKTPPIYTLKSAEIVIYKDKDSVSNILSDNFLIREFFGLDIVERMYILSTNLGAKLEIKDTNDNVVFERVIKDGDEESALYSAIRAKKISRDMYAVVSTYLDLTDGFERLFFIIYEKKNGLLKMVRDSLTYGYFCDGIVNLDDMGNEYFIVLKYIGGNQLICSYYDSYYSLKDYMMLNGIDGGFIYVNDNLFGLIVMDREAGEKLIIFRIYNNKLEKVMDINFSLSGYIRAQKCFSVKNGIVVFDDKMVILIPVDFTSVQKQEENMKKSSPFMSYVTTKYVYVEDVGEEEIERIEVFNLLGQRVKSKYEYNKRQIIIDVSELPSGIYFFIIKGRKSDLIRGKIIKVK